MIIWFTGRPSAGKTTICKAIEAAYSKGEFYVLDGDDLRKGVSSDLGFSPEDREENLRRAAHIAKILSNAGVYVLAAFITPRERNRRTVKKICGNEYMEVYVKCGLRECKRRDPKGNYKKAVEGRIEKFTGIDDVFERPRNSDLVLDTEKKDLTECVREVINMINRRIYK